ncbi:MAG: 4Fe-4S binding protein, partial [Kiloniellales bacterium]
GLGHGGGRIRILDQQDPEAVETSLHELERRDGPPAGNFLPMGGKRARTMLALRHLHEKAPQPIELLPLPPGAPFGAVKVDTGACTLCLACVPACPTGALVDAPGQPWLGFTEEACVQCGLCRNTCPESAITLEPRLNFTESARSTVRLNEEPPFHCIRCGKPFGVRRSIERIATQLAGKHWMFESGPQVERIMMCDDCRVVVEFERPDAPFAGTPRPRIRTTEDDLREREIERAAAGLAPGKPNGGEAS